MVKAGGANFGDRLLGAVKIGSGEVRGLVCRVAVLTRSEIRPNDSAKIRVLKGAECEARHQRSKTTDRGRGEDAVVSEYAVGLTKGLQAIRSINEVVQGPEQKKRIGTGGRDLQVASVATRDRCQCDARRICIRSRLLQMKFHWIDQVNLVSLCSKRKSVDPGCTADI